MARPKAPDYEQQRDRIVATAVQAFARTGYRDASLSALAADCGASKARLYHYFDSKESVLFEALTRYTDRLNRVVDEIRSRRLAPAEELRALMLGLTAEYRRSHEFHVVLLNDARYLAEPMHTTIRARERRVVDAIESALAAAYPRVGTADRKALTMALIGAVHYTTAWLRRDGPIGLEDFAGIVLGLFDDALSARPVATGPAAGQDGATALADQAA